MILKISLVIFFIFPPWSGVVLPESSPSAGGWDECEGLVGGEPGADGAALTHSRSQPEGGEQLAGRPCRPGVRSAGVTKTPQHGPAEGQCGYLDRPTQHLIQ